MRKTARETMNLLLVHPISTSSDSAIQAVGKLLTGKEPAPNKPYVILDTDHPLREGRDSFVLCPAYAKKSTEISSLSALDTEEARLFHKALQNLGRYEPAVDGAGKPMDLLAAAPYGTDRVTPESPLFNPFTGLIFVRVMAKVPRMDHLLDTIVRVGDKHNLDAVFDLKVLDTEGHEVYLIGPEFVALMDFVVSTCLWAQLPQLAAHRPFYNRRVALYAALDGKNGHLDMRGELKAVLEEFFDCHPQHAKSMRRSKKRSVHTAAEIVDLSQDDIDAFVRRSPCARRTGAGTFLSHPQNQRPPDTSSFCSRVSRQSVINPHRRRWRRSCHRRFRCRSVY